MFTSKFTEVDVLLPKKLGANATLNLVMETIQTHVTEPWPEYATQKDEQAMRYTTDLFALSPYPTLVQRTKIKYVPQSVDYPSDINDTLQ
jgi:oligosaccharyltransferase complex subunit alpha (ribophorin I)